MSNPCSLSYLLHITLVMVIVILSGCNTLSKNECLSADWNLIGYQDGYNGFEKSRLKRHQQSCAQYRVTPNLEQYLDGYTRGNQEFCQPENGFHQGVKGYTFVNTCAGEFSQQFRDAYLQGRAIYDLKKEILDEWRMMRKKKDKITFLKRKRKTIELDLSRKTISDLEKELYIENIALINEQINLILDSIELNEKRISDLENELEHLKKIYVRH